MNSNYKRFYISQPLKLGDHITFANKHYHYIKNVLRIKKMNISGYLMENKGNG